LDRVGALGLPASGPTARATAPRTSAPVPARALGLGRAALSRLRLGGFRPGFGRRCFGHRGVPFSLRTRSDSVRGDGERLLAEAVAFDPLVDPADPAGLQRRVERPRQLERTQATRTCGQEGLQLDLVAGE